MMDAMGESFWTGGESHLPDPDRDRQFYDGVPMRRFVAFVIDTVLILAMDVVAIAVLSVLGVVTFGLTWLLMGVAWFALGFAYRVLTLGSGRSATPGMRLTGIEIRNSRGGRLSMNEALVHTGGLYVVFFFMPLIAISAIMMAVGSRGRGLHDLPLGSTAINTPI